jgi:multidrug resistance efflux pump
MIRKVSLPLMAVGMLGYAALHVNRGPHTGGPPPTMLEVPVQSPYPGAVAALGVVEARTENIAIGSPIAGMVTHVKVRAGQQVHAGDALFSLDDQQAVEELKCQQAKLATAQAKLARLQSLPRAEEVPAAEARVREARAHYEREADLLNRARALMVGGAASRESVIVREQAFRVVSEQLARAQDDLELLKAGAWAPDRVVAHAIVAEGTANVQRAKVDLDRLVVRAPMDGQVLQVNVRPGEYASIPPRRALVLLGDVQHLHVRVSIDEHDIPRFRPGGPGRAMIRGRPQEQLALTFVRVEPCVVPKLSLSGDAAERIDTYVLHVIYAIEPLLPSTTLYVGQRMDVFISND